ncbi:alpha-L-fucosidase [Edaphobacter modestus]|uniref:alpha-L-fucosidase n=1 Tax=Edaphobacter modestus TaxID=388466 RepID=A0A4Q7YV24_9BACT|nr:alpha-L-fucosidase [Edaphobacter modestus]RZU41500.1 alpha-L-fucosidase [Edaphobacter modestus]
MPISRRRILTDSALLAAASLLPRPLTAAQTGAPQGAADAYATPKPDLNGPVQPTWESFRDTYAVPTWFNQAKFGIFIHWGLYSIPAHGSEWYERHMYKDAEGIKWHAEHYGPQDKFGYKEFIPLFKPDKYHAEEWISLFQRAGARYVVPVAEHHDGFPMYRSELTPWCAGRMGPKRDLTGELATAARRQNLIFGLSSHRMEHAYFAYPAKGLKTDQFNPMLAGFYGPPIDQQFNSGANSKIFQLDWLARVQELIDKFEPQMLYFDNGVNPREYDEVKLRAAAYLYNRARERGYQATLATKDDAYLFATVQDFEGTHHAPKWPYAGAWQCDTPIGNSWGYIEGLKVASGLSLIHQIVAVASCGGNLLLNISPKGDGSIPEDQQQSLSTLGDWLTDHGEAIYGSRAWIMPGEGPAVSARPNGDWKGRSTGILNWPRVSSAPEKPYTEADFRFTTKDGKLYAIGYKEPTGEATIRSLSTAKAKVERVSLLGKQPQPVKFHQTAEGLVLILPPQTAKSEQPYVLRVEGMVPVGL